MSFAVMQYKPVTEDHNRYCPGVGTADERGTILVRRAEEAVKEKKPDDPRIKAKQQEREAQKRRKTSGLTAPGG